MDFNERKLKQIKKIPEELYVEKWQDQYFGSQKINSVQVFLNSLKFIYSEKAIKFCEISTNYLTGSTLDK